MEPGALWVSVMRKTIDGDDIQAKWKDPVKSQALSKGVHGRLSCG